MNSILSMDNPLNVGPYVKLIGDTMSGSLIVQGTLTLASDIIHEGDLDTTLSFGLDQWDVTVGGVNMIQAKEDPTQNVLYLGDVVGTGDVDVNTNDGHMFIRGIDGFVGIANVAPTVQLDITGDVAAIKNQNAATSIRCVNNTDGTAAWASINVSAHITSDNQGFSMQVFPDAFTAFTGPGGMSLAGWGRFRTDSQVKGLVFNATASAGQLVFATKTIQAIRVHDDQRIEFGTGTADPGAKLLVDQASTVQAIPVVSYDQANVDEPFEKYIGTSTAATLNRSLVDNADVTTATLVGWRRIEIEDTGPLTDGDYFVPYYSLA